MKPTVAIIAAGAMGSAIAQHLTRHGVTILTSLEGRSPASQARAKTAGMEHATDEQIAQRAKLILSVVPPAEAVGLAERFAAVLQAADHRPIYIDCNAISSTTVVNIGRIMESAGARFVDGSIIGPPPKDDDLGPTFYFSGDTSSELAELKDYGLRIKVLDGPIGAASALKLSYAGITKGLIALGAAMVLAAERAGAGQALKEELNFSQPLLLARFSKTLPDMYPKAYRWVEEMHAIAEFIGEPYPEGKIFEGAADLYARLAADISSANIECGVIDKFLNRDCVGEPSARS